MTNLTHKSFLCIYFNSVHVSSNLVLIVRRVNCINTTSGVCHSVSVTVSCAGWKDMFQATSCSSSGESIASIQHLVYVALWRWPFRVQVGKILSDLHTKRSPTQNDIYQMLYWDNWFSWWWARGCSKHVENWNKYIEKNFASSWSFTKNHSPNSVLAEIF